MYFLAAIDEKVQVIRHQDIPPNRNVTILGQQTKGAK